MASQRPPCRPGQGLSWPRSTSPGQPSSAGPARSCCFASSHSQASQEPAAHDYPVVAEQLTRSGMEDVFDLLDNRRQLYGNSLDIPLTDSIKIACYEFSSVFKFSLSPASFLPIRTKMSAPHLRRPLQKQLT